MKKSTGNEVFLSKPHTVIGIFDIDSSTTSYTTREFLRASEKKKILVSLSKDIPRSIIITDDKVYLSGISSKTLRSRLENSAFQKAFNSEITEKL